jgi:hypothetical protein
LTIEATAAIDRGRHRRPAMKILQLLPVFALSVALAAADIHAEIPKESKESLHASASHALTGKVAGTYERIEKRADFETTYGIAEVAVERVDKGAEIVAGDRIFVRYWRKRWVGKGNPPPDHYGHWNLPEATDAVVVYVRGDRTSGYDVLSPNGFFETTKATSEKPAGDK